MIIITKKKYAMRTSKCGSRFKVNDYQVIQSSRLLCFYVLYISKYAFTFAISITDLEKLFLNTLCASFHSLG